ncbi:MAG: glycosyltransferase family 1 protein, partial [Byssovorax sp.]
DLLCFSHLRWGFVHQRPQHLLTRFGRTRRVFFFEEPMRGDGPARLEVNVVTGGVHVAVPHLPHSLGERESIAAQRELVAQMIERYALRDYVAWYYTPMALPFSRHLEPVATIYDCMDQLSAFKGAPAELEGLEAELFRRADVVLTGGHSLYEAKRHLHGNIHPLPSSVDVAHFARARGVLEAPADQARIPRPRLGFFGVVDERMDLDLVAALAAARPDWHLVIVGPIVKIDPGTLPRSPNIHYLGSRTYEELPAYLAGWDVALMPFALNESTRYISPTKTPEYLAAGKPVISTSIRDVVKPYGELGLVRIADTLPELVSAVQACLADERRGFTERVDRLLGQMSWDRTWARAEELLGAAVEGRRGARQERACSTT